MVCSITNLSNNKINLESDNESNNESDNNYNNDEYDDEYDDELEKKKIMNYIGNISKNTNNTNNKEYVEYIEYKTDNFFQKLGQNTFGLDKVIPWEESNFVLSGGLLYDIITNRFSQDLMDIDLFFYGDVESKYKTINKLLDNLDLEQYKYLIGYIGSVIYIFVQGIPRIIQLIMTSKSNPIDIIKLFDFSHVKSYYDGKNIYSNKETIGNFLDKKTSIIIKHKHRLIKYYERGLDISNLIWSDNNYIINNYDDDKIIKNKKQIQLYKSTYNLTKIIVNKSYEYIDFLKFPTEIINLHKYFGCRINYNKLDNYEFKENINMFGAFIDYFKFPDDKPILMPNNSKSTINEPLSKNINFEKYDFSQISLTQTGILLSLHDSSIYTKCKFISHNFNENTEYSQIFFKIENESIIDFLEKKIDTKKIIDGIIKSFANWFNGSSDKLLKDLKDSLKNFDTNKIKLPFIEKNDKSSIISTKLYEINLSLLKELSGDILDKLETGQIIDCFSHINIYIKFIKKQGKTDIDDVQINLVPKYIFVK